MRSKLARWMVVLLFAVGLLGVAAAPLVAQQAAPRPARPGPAAQPSVYELPQSPQNEFVPLKELVRDTGLPPAQERIPAAPLVMGAYAFVWVALLVYVWSIWRRIGAVQRELAELRRRTERKA